MALSRQDANRLAVPLSHSSVLAAEVWDNEDFIIYFEGHWETWEFKKETQSVRHASSSCLGFTSSAALEKDSHARLRTKEEKLAQMLATVKDIDGVGLKISCIGNS